MKIKIDDLSNPVIEAFLQQHLDDMFSASSPESCHVLDIESLKQPSVTFWTLWATPKDSQAKKQAEQAQPSVECLLGCGAIQRIDNTHAEIKSMRIASTHRGQGLANWLLEHIIKEAIAMGYQRLSLETGSMDFFAPARSLYEKYGFSLCAPFANYKEDPESVYMTLAMDKPQ